MSYTYQIKSGHFDNNMIKSLLNKRGNWSEYTQSSSSSSSPLTFLYVDGDIIYKDKSHYTQKSTIKNLFDQSSYKIGNKSLLYTEFCKYNQQLCEKYMAKQYHIDHTTNLSQLKHLFPNRYMLKPITGIQGFGIKIFTNYDDFYEYTNNYLKKKPTKEWVLSQYLDEELLLFNNHKFHLRVFFLVLKDPNTDKLRGFILDKMYLLPAQKPYDSQSSDPSVTDTHFSREHFKYFPSQTNDVFTKDQTKQIFDNIHKLFYHVLQFTTGSPYEEQDMAYHIFGCDVFITKDFDVKLIEINDLIGHCPDQMPECRKFNKYYIESQLEVAIDPFFPPKNKVKQYNGFHEITNLVGGNMNTFLIQTEYLNYNDTKQIILKRGNWREYKESIDGPDVTLLYIDGTRLKGTYHYKYKAYIKSSLDDGKKNITHKRLLYENFMSKYPNECKKYMLEQMIITKDNYMDLSPTIFDKIRIIKPVLAGKSQGLQVIENYDSYLEYMEKNKIYLSHGWMLEEYIHDPLLYNKRKFHLRVYLLFHKHAGKKYGYLSKRSRMLLAKEEYTPSDWLNKDIHDSHFNGQKHIEFPGKFSEEYGADWANSVARQVEEIGYYLWQIVDGECYRPDSQECFYIFGLDILPLKNKRVVLLEANEYASLKHNEDMKEYFKEFFDGIMSLVVDKLVKPANVVRQNDFWLDLSGVVGGYKKKYLKYKKRYVQTKRKRVLD